jgi:hypothetical protein
MPPHTDTASTLARRRRGGTARLNAALQHDPDTRRLVHASRGLRTFDPAA